MRVQYDYRLRAGRVKIKTAQWMILLVERKELKQKKAQWMYPLHMQGVFLQEKT